MRVKVDGDAFPITAVTEVKAQEHRLVPAIAAPILDRYPSELVAETMNICDPGTWLILLTLTELRRNVFQVKRVLLYPAACFPRRQFIVHSSRQGLFDQLALSNRRRD